MSLSSRGSTVAAKRRTLDRYTVEVVTMAMMVPIGMDFWASARSPERLEPAIIPAWIISCGRMMSIVDTEVYIVGKTDGICIFQ